MVETREKVRVHIRWMIRRDLPEVFAIEAASFEHAWTEENFLHCLRQRNIIGMVAEKGDKVLGFMIYELHKNKLHILNFAVHPHHRRRSVGSQMVAKLISKLATGRRTSVTLEVRETNLAAQLFFRRQMFLATQVEHGYYDDSGEDAYKFEYELQEEQTLPFIKETSDEQSGRREAELDQVTKHRRGEGAGGRDQGRHGDDH